MICAKSPTARPSAKTGAALRCASLLRPWVRVFLLLLALAGPAVLAGMPALAATFLERAQEYLDKGDRDAAKIELKNALQRDPNNAEARFLLGSILLKEGDAAGAQKELLRARDLGYQNDQLDLMLTYSQLNQGQFNNVLSSVSDHLVLETQIQKDLMVARGDALLGLGKLKEAEAVFDRVLQQGPHARALTNKARIAMILGDASKARSLLDQALTVDPDDSLAVLMDGEWYLRAERYEEAKGRFARAVQLDPTRLVAYVGQIQSHIALKEFDEADRIVQLLKREQPNNLLVSLQEGIVEFLKGNYQVAKSAADKVLAADAKQLQALLISGESAYQLKQYEQARARLSVYLDLRPDDNQARLLLGDAMLKLGYSKEAYETVKEPDGKLPDNSDYLGVLTSAALSAGDKEAGVKYLTQLAEREPNNVDVQNQLGSLRMTMGDPGGAIEAFQHSLKLDPDRLETYAQIFTARMQQGNPDLALEVTQQIVSKFPDKSAGHTLAGIAYMSKRETEKARAAFETAVEKEPDSAEAAGNLVSLLRLEGKTDEARGVLDRTLQKQPGSLPLLMAYADMELKAGAQQKSEELLRQAIKYNPEEVQPRIDLGNQYIEANRPVDALLVTEDALRRHPSNLGLLETVGRAKMNSGDRSGAKDAFDQLAALAPENPTAQQYHMWALEQNGDIAAALAAARRTLKLEPTNAAARFAEVRYLAQLGELSAASEKLKGLQADYSDNADLSLTEGRIALAERRAADAIAAYREAFKLRHINFVLVELARALLITGQHQEAVKEMQDWLGQYPNDLLVHTALAEAFRVLGRDSDAEEQYLAILKLYPDRASALNDLAWVRLTQDRIDAAEEPARRAVKLEPKNPDYADTLAMILLRSNDKAEALDLLRRARTGAAENESIRLHFAQALAANGHHDDAVKELKALLQQEKPFRERAEAEALLAKLTQ